ncbi:MAG: hydrogenase maturation nickel metallochaperone HypA [Candidatus Latescibacteria bacterium]|nr:hydrogenase maturation nickel metallochaperone HypA [bacterium]MBD3424062.1 hydrogenase maturation nickel metallochaperone HypA [Candidatus Latescibacterota bacterium]
MRLPECLPGRISPGSRLDWTGEREKMHEVSLMQNVMSVVSRAAEQQGGGKVSSIHLKIGAMAGVNLDSLRFAFDIISRGTVAEEGKLEIQRVPLKLHCTGCGREYTPGQFSMTCPSCGSSDIEIITGREMQVDYIMMEDQECREGSP